MLPSIAILIDQARRYRALRHGGGLQRVSLDDDAVAAERTDVLLALDEASIGSRH
jgi:ECF sigma factor